MSIALGLSVLLVSSVLPEGAAPARVWLDSLNWVVPGPSATRVLLAADCFILLLAGLKSPSLVIGPPLSLGVGFLTLTLLGMLLNDFYLALVLFHLVVGAAAIVRFSGRRWIGAGLIAGVLFLGLVT